MFSNGSFGWFFIAVAAAVAAAATADEDVVVEVADATLGIFSNINNEGITTCKVSRRYHCHVRR